MHQRRGSVRVLDYSSAAIAQVKYGMDSQKFASYKRAQLYAEEAVDQGLLWLDLIPGEYNPSDVPTKHPGSIQEYAYKADVLCGARLFLMKPPLYS